MVQRHERRRFYMVSKGYIFAMRCDAMRCDAMRCDAMRCDALRCVAMVLIDINFYIANIRIIGELYKIIFVKILRFRRG